MESFEYPIGHSNDSNFNIPQPDFIPEPDFENLLSAIQCETKDPSDIFCVDTVCNHVTDAGTAFQLSPHLYDHNEAIDGVGTDIGIDIDVDIDIDIDIGNGNETCYNDTGIGIYDGMGPNLYNHNEAIDGVGIDIDIDNVNDTCNVDAGIGIYDGMDANLYDHNVAIDDIGIDFDISSGSGSGTGTANDIGNGIGFYDEMDPNLYDHNEAIDGIGIGIDIDIDNCSDGGIGCYEDMDPDLYLIWDEDEDDLKVPGDGYSSETMPTPNPKKKRKGGGGVKSDRTKSLISERKRRIGMKENLYTLRTLVPNITKLDKASIVGDATRYIQDLQTQARNLRSEIAKVEATSKLKKASRKSNMTHVSNSLPISKKILKLEMFNVEEKGYYVKVVCNKGRGVTVALLKALESITGIQVQSSNLETVGDTVVLTFTLKVVARESDKKPPNWKLRLSGAFLKQGFELKTIPSR